MFAQKIVLLAVHELASAGSVCGKGQAAAVRRVVRGATVAQSQAGLFMAGTGHGRHRTGCRKSPSKTR